MKDDARRQGGTISSGEAEQSRNVSLVTGCLRKPEGALLPQHHWRPVHLLQSDCCLQLVASRHVLAHALQADDFLPAAPFRGLSDIATLCNGLREQFQMFRQSSNVMGWRLLRCRLAARCGARSFLIHFSFAKTEKDSDRNVRECRQFGAQSGAQ